MASLESALEGALDDRAEPLGSVGELVESYGGMRRGGAQAAASDLGVSARTVERWVKAERGEPGETRRPPTERTRLSAADRTSASRLRGLFSSRERRYAALVRSAKGRKVVLHYHATFRPYPSKNKAPYTTSGSIILPSHVLNAIARGDLGEASDEIAYDMVAEEFSFGLAGAPEEAEIDVHSLSIEIL